MPNILNTATNLNHILHPYNIPEKNDEKASLANKIAGIALFVFSSIVTIGTMAVFLLVTAHRKLKNIKVISQHQQHIPFPSKPSTQSQSPCSSSSNIPSPFTCTLPFSFHFPVPLPLPFPFPDPLPPSSVTYSRSPAPKSTPLQHVDNPGSINSENPVSAPQSSFPSQLKPYNLVEVINHIREKSLSGQQLGLFVGRQPHEPLPVEPGVTWVSLDLLGPDTLDLKKLHLKIQLQDPKDFAQISGLFNKVILDQSTLKFFGSDPWRYLGRLLKQDPSSMLITESKTGLGYPRMSASEIPNNRVPNGANHFVIRERRHREDNFKINNPQGYATEALNEEYDLEANRALPYLGTLFTTVDYFTDRPFPFHTDWMDKSGNDRHFVFRGPQPSLLKETPQTI